jgi:predicted permease
MRLTWFRRFDSLPQDARHAVRGLWRDRSFALTALVTLALAVGLNVTVFAVTGAVLFRGFPLVEDNDRLLYIQEQFPLGQCCISYPDFEAWRTGAVSFEAMAFVQGRQVTFSQRPGERGIDIFARATTANAFGVLGVRPALGRDFVFADEAPGAPSVAILEHDFWQNRFGGRDDIVGDSVEINGEPATVIGVMPAGFDFPSRENLWVPLVRTPELLVGRTPGGYLAVGRLADGATAATARVELETINRRLAAEYPATNRDVVPRVGTFAEFFVGPDAAPIYWSVWAAGLFVLLIACANLANLALARALGKSQELSTRIALGSGRWRLVQQILCEWLLLACAAGALAWQIAVASINAWAAATESPYQVLDYTVDGGTLAYLVAVALGAASLIALAPIARVLHLDIRGAFRAGTRGATQGLRTKRTSSLLVAGQVTLAIVLLCGTGVLVRSFWNVVSADAGVEAPEQVVIGLVTPPRDKYGATDSRAAFYDALRARLQSVPGVELASVSNSRPVNNMRVVPFDIEGPAGGTIGSLGVSVLAAGTDYFRTVGGTTLTGREFDDRDAIASPLVAVVNQSFAARYFPGRDPIGLRVRFYDNTEPGEWRTIVGVVANIMQSDPTRQRFQPLVYLPFRQAPPPNAWFFSRARAPAEEVMAGVRAAVLSLDADLMLEDFSTLKASFRFIASRMDIEHVNMGKLAAVAPIFAGIALLLATIGLYAVLARSVSQRTREIGVRMAIGATQRNIRRLVLREELLPVVLGLVFGLAASLAVNRVLQSQLVGVSPYDPVTLVVTPIVLIVVALIACQLPARRAMGIDPSVALRDD